MMLFEIECQYGNDKFVFGWSEQKAVEQFVTWQMANEAPAGDFTVKRITISSQSDIRATHLREALGLGIQGIGVYDAHHGWEIRSVDDERPMRTGA